MLKINFLLPGEIFILQVWWAKTCKENQRSNSAVKKHSKEICTLLIVSWLCIITGRIIFLNKMFNDTTYKWALFSWNYPTLFWWYALKQCHPKLTAYKILSVSSMLLENQKNQQQQKKKGKKNPEKNSNEGLEPVKLQHCIGSPTTVACFALQKVEVRFSH